MGGEQLVCEASVPFTAPISSPPRSAMDVVTMEMITGRQPESAGEGDGPTENNGAHGKSLKRPNGDSDDEEDKSAIAPPVHDIYRARQQKRIR